MCERAPQQYGQTTYDQGSFSTGAIWDGRFVYKVPDNMASEAAAPLMCGGWTVWNALTGYNVKPTDHIGIVGIGGLGHLALQFANKLGCEVTAFSNTESKKAEALSLGAYHFVSTKGAKELKLARPIDHLFICANVHIDWNLFTPILAGRASVYPLQIPEDLNEPFSVPHMQFLMKSINIIYSTNGPHTAYERMLAFAALHDVKPIIETFPMTKDGIEKGMEMIQSGKVRYRGVLVV
jgi:D-arabinose 1-dehydrogenase-like Zn-dependent alcohol dehydrogenase